MCSLKSPSFKDTKCFFSTHFKIFSITENSRDLEVAWLTTATDWTVNPVSAWRAVSYQEVLSAQFSLYVNKCDLKSHYAHFRGLQNNVSLFLLLDIWRWNCSRKMFLSRSMLKNKHCGEPPWPRGSVIGLRPSGLEFWILCLEGSVISFISPSSGGSPGSV